MKFKDKSEFIGFLDTLSAGSRVDIFRSGYSASVPYLTLTISHDARKFRGDCINIGRKSTTTIGGYNSDMGFLFRKGLYVKEAI